MTEREIFAEEHGIFRDAVKKFFAKECVPHAEEWDKAGVVSREAWKKAGAAGLLCMTTPEEYGGGGGGRG